jgi:hypothetical protein
MPLRLGKLFVLLGSAGPDWQCLATFLLRVLMAWLTTGLTRHAQQAGLSSRPRH